MPTLRDHMAKEELERKLRPTYESGDPHTDAGDLERQMRPTYESGDPHTDAGNLETRLRPTYESSDPHTDAGKHGGGHHGGGHHGGGHHGGGHHGGGHHRGGGGRSRDVIVVSPDCPRGFYYDDLGNCRPLPYHSQGVQDGAGFDAGFDDVDGKAYRETYSIYNAGALEDSPQAFDEKGSYIGPGAAEAEEGAFPAETSTRTSTTTASPTRTETSTKAYTSDNVTVTGGAGNGNTSVTIYGRAPAPADDAAGPVPVGWFNPFDPFGSGYAANTNRERNALNDAIVQTDIRVTANSGKIPSDVLADYISFRKDWAAVNNETASVDQLNSMRARFRGELDRLAPFMKVDDLKPPAPIGKQVASAIDAFTDSTKKAGDAAQIGILGLLVIAAVVAYVAAPELLRQGQASAGLAAKLAK